MAFEFKNMKNFSVIFAKGSILLIGIVAFLGSASCSDDYEFDYVMDVNINYSITLGEAWFDFYDINISYSLGGSEATAVATGDWNYSMTLPNMDMSEITPKYTFEVVANRKDSYPEIDENASYDFSYDHSETVYGEREGEIVFHDTSSQGSNLIVPGDQVATYLKTKERTLVSYSRTFDPKSVYK